VLNLSIEKLFIVRNAFFEEIPLHASKEQHEETSMLCPIVDLKYDASCLSF